MPAPAGWVGGPRGPNQVHLPANGSFSSSECTVNGNHTVDTVGRTPEIRVGERRTKRASRRPATLTKPQVQITRCPSPPIIASTVTWNLHAAVRVGLGSTGWGELALNSGPKPESSDDGRTKNNASQYFSHV